MTDFRFYRCQEIRCPSCGEQLDYLLAPKGDPRMLLRHPAGPHGKKCHRSGKQFYAAPQVVELTEFVEEKG